MRILTAGESHGKAIITVIEGFPQGVRIEEEFINAELRRRKQGYGRGKRMQIEEDKVEIIAGIRNRVTLGSPIALLVKNKDWTILSDKNDNLPSLVIPRPGHADLAGILKFQEKDIRNILERASARETVSRVCAGAVCKQLLRHFNVEIASFVRSIGKVYSEYHPQNIKEIRDKLKKSKLNCIDHQKERKMKEEIDKAKKRGDTLGGIIEIWAEEVFPGLGSCMHFDKRLDAKIASYLMSIPAVKGVEIGAGFKYAQSYGSRSHDVIAFSPQFKKYMRVTNNAGGIEGGISNGEPIVARIGLKPIPTLATPLSSVNIKTKQKTKAEVIRSDACVVEAAGVIAESMLAIALVESILDKFGRDTLKEIKNNYKSYLRTVTSL